MALAVLVFDPAAALAANRVALVVGNSNYSNAGFLPNAAKDARDISETLRKLGFDVHDGYDLTRIEMLKLAARVTSGLTSDDVALFYFSGHGIQLGSENYILPTDARGSDAAELKSASVSLQSVLREMELRADRNIVILDACRNNPFDGAVTGRSVGGASRGLARVDAGVGSYIAFSTQPGNVALDGSGQNSPFTGALVRHLADPEGDIHEVMRKVRADVVDATGGAQVPWENSSMIEQLYLAQPGGRPAGQTLAVATLAPAAATQANLPAFRHMVAGLDPNGDGFLALRSGNHSGAQRLAKMTEGTRLAVLEQDGVWFRVRTETGMTGWAHSNWIRFIGEQAPQSANQCETLWTQRNAFFHKYGYCFKSERGKAAFPNPTCNPTLTASNVPLTAFERSEVTRLKGLETSLGCN